MDALRLITGRRLGIAAALGGAAALYYSRRRAERLTPLAEALEARRETFASDAVGRVSVYADRSGSGEPVLLLHSINAAASAYEMKPLFERLRGQRPVYAPDLPGFGFSQRGARDYTPALYRDAILEVIKRIVRTEPVHVVASSLSAEFAAAAAARAPEAFASLTLLSPTGFGSEPESGSAQRRELVARQAQKALESAIWGPALFDGLVSRPSILYFLRKSFVAEVDPGLIDYAYATAHQPGARYAPAAFVGGRLFSDDAPGQLYGQVVCPTLVVHDEDAYTDFAHLDEFVARHDNWRVQRVSPTRGLPQFERPDATLAAMHDLWGGPGARSGAESEEASFD